MVVADLEAAGHSVPAPVLRERRELGGVTLRAVRAVRGVGALAGARRPAPHGHAAPARHAGAARAQVPADVHSVYTSKIVSSERSRVRRVR